MDNGRRVLVACLAALASQSSLAIGFQGLGVGEGCANVARAMSADGSTVVGLSFATCAPIPVYGAFRWTGPTGVQLLGPTDGTVHDARGVSGDGSVIVGGGTAGAFIWSESTGSQFPGFYIANDISADGSTVVGTANNLPGSQPVFWTATNGVSVLPGVPNVPLLGEAHGISADGSTIVGTVATADNGYRTVFEAAAWFGGAAPVILGAGPTSSAHAASADGSVIVGQYFVSGQYRAFRWTQAGGFQPLPEPPWNTSDMRAFAVSGDGSIVVGESFNIATNKNEAFIWDAQNGTRGIRDILVGAGQAEGWDLYEALGISADGRLVTGYGRSPFGSEESWIADLQTEGSPFAAFTLSAASVAGCKTVTGRVTLSEPAPAGGRVVTISDSLGAAFPPASVTIAEGAISKTFTIWTTPVEVAQAGIVSATLGGTTLTRDLQVRPIGVKSVTISPTTVVGGLPATARAVLECKAGPGPITVELSSGYAAVAYPVAVNGVVPQGLTTLIFDVATNPVLAKRSVAITAAANGIGKSRSVAVDVAAAVSAKALRFGDVPVGTASTTLSTTLRNRGAMPFAIDSITLTGTNAKYYSQASNCPAALAAGASCSIGVTFAPVVAGSKSAKLSIATSATATPLSVSLSGTGI